MGTEEREGGAREEMEMERCNEAGGGRRVLSLVGDCSSGVRGREMADEAVEREWVLNPCNNAGNCDEVEAIDAEWEGEGECEVEAVGEWAERVVAVLLVPLVSSIQ